MRGLFSDKVAPISYLKLGYTNRQVQETCKVPLFVIDITLSAIRAALPRSPVRATPHGSPVLQEETGVPGENL